MSSPTRLQEQIRITLASESRRDPRVSVVEVPDGNTDAAVDFNARGDRAVVVGDLLGLGGRGGWECETDVKFGDDDVDAEGGEGLLVGCLGGLGGCFAYERYVLVRCGFDMWMSVNECLPAMKCDSRPTPSIWIPRPLSSLTMFCAAVLLLPGYSML